MTLFNFYIYNRKGKCLFYKEWHRPLNTLADDPIEERKLVFGMLFSLKDLASKLSPNSQTKENLHTIKTNAFTLHQFETVSGLVFVINTNPDIPNMHSHLQQIYSTIYIDCVARNPLYQLKTDEPIQCPLFLTRLEEYLFGLPFLKQ